MKKIFITNTMLLISFFLIYSENNKREPGKDGAVRSKV